MCFSDLASRISDLGWKFGIWARTARPPPFRFGAAFLYQFLHDGFLAGLFFEDAAKAVDVFARDGLENDAVVLFPKNDGRARLDAEPASEPGGDSQTPVRCDAGGHFQFAVH